MNKQNEAPFTLLMRERIEILEEKSEAIETKLTMLEIFLSQGADTVVKTPVDESGEAAGEQ